MQDQRDKKEASVVRSFAQPAIVLAAAWVLAAPSASADWPRWRGPNGDGISQDTALLEQWPEGGPSLEWKATGIGVGMAAVSVANGRIYTSGDQDSKAWLFALDEADGSLIWTIRRIVAAQ